MSLFKKFTKEDDVTSTTLLKSSKGRAVRKQIEEQFPALGASLEDVFPKKSEVRYLFLHDKKKMFLFFSKLSFLSSWMY